MNACSLFSLRRVLLALSLLLFGMLLFGTFYLQMHLGLVPCPMCVVQRYVYVLMAVVLLLAGLTPKRCVHVAAGWLAVALAAFGLFTAGRQSWLQWYPPEFFSCGRDPFSMVNQIGLAEVLPKVFAGQGDCTAVDWAFLGLSIANWSFLAFAASMAVLLAAMLCPRCKQAKA